MAAERQFVIRPLPGHAARHASIIRAVKNIGHLNRARALRRGEGEPCGRSLAMRLASFSSVSPRRRAFAADDQALCARGLASDVVRLAESAAQGDGAERRQAEGQERRAIAQGRGRGERRRAISRPRAAWLGAAVAANPKELRRLARAARKLGAAADDAQANGRWELVEPGDDRRLCGLSSAPAAPPRRPRRWRCSAISSRATKIGAPRSTPIAPAWSAATTRTSRKTYEDLREKHGFRIVDYKVDNESAAPRVCFNFSEPLARKTDFAPYVAVAGASNSAISTEEQQICVEGLKHGERYAIVVARGPALRRSAKRCSSRPITRSTCATARRRPISPASAYVLPRQGQLGAPLTTVNTQRSRSTSIASATAICMSTIARDDFLKPISCDRAPSEIENAGRRQGLERVDGHRLRAQQGHRHRFSARATRSANCSPASI